MPAPVRMDSPDRQRGVTPAPEPAGPTVQVPEPSPDPASTPTRTGTALQSAAAGYTAAHGASVAPVPGPRRRWRWAVSSRLAAGAGAVLLLVGGGVALRAASISPGPAVSLPVPVPSGTPAQAGGSTAPPTAQVVVDVVGAVAAPGVVRLAEGSRVVDAIAAAGSATADAQLGALNLARLLVDGEQVVVPAAGDPAAVAGPSAAAGGDERVDLNAADAAALDALPGIGPVLAGRIVAHREDRPYASVDELADVPGIGPTLLERLRDLVRV